MSLSALKADVDRKTARKYVGSKLRPEQLQKPHTWRTRPDPLAAIWPQVEAMLREAPELEAKTLMEFLVQQPGATITEGQLRTLQRRIRQWRGTHGPELDVMFDQRREPGELMELDWTHPGDLEVSIQGERLDHLLFHGVLAYSNWQWAVRCQSESYLSLVGGLQACLGKLGRVPRHIGTDNSSAATHQIEAGKRAYNPDYLDLAEHYGFVPITINVGCPNEHGDVESANRHLKRRVDQHLMLRGSRDFETVEAYDAFIGLVMEKANARRRALVERELAAMEPLTVPKLAEYRERDVRVGRNSTIRVNKVSYSVPSRLIGQSLRVHEHESELRLYLGREPILTLPRRRGDRGAVIDFRHVVGPLLRKPGAFQNYQHREQLYPSPGYRTVYDLLVTEHGTRAGVIEYLQLLKLAAEHGVEVIEERFQSRMRTGRKWRSGDIGMELHRTEATASDVAELTPELASYDAFLEREVEHVG